MDTWTAFKEDIAHYRLIKPGSRILLAVSGGPDSVCLAHLFWRLSKTMPVTIFIAHMDHGLRRESHADANFVRLLGKKLGIDVTVENVDIRRCSARDSISLETAGRDERYRALAAIAARLRCSLIATGHTANDNAETVLMWLLRGTGPDGLCGIPRERPLGRRSISVLCCRCRAHLSCRISVPNAFLSGLIDRIRAMRLPETASATILFR